jgi:hypothetical protein
MMKMIRSWVAILSLVGLTALSGCGSGYVDNSFDIGIRVNGFEVPNVYVPPGFQEDVSVRVGSRFEAFASTPVAWTIEVDGRVLNPPIGTSVDFRGITLTPTAITNGRYAANTSALGILPIPVVVSVIATSLSDSRQQAQINVVLSN